jgi:hypothetical protein
MMLPPARRLARYVDPALDEKRVDRVWAGISARRISTWSMRRLALPAGVTAVALAAALVLVARARTMAPAPPLAGLVLESGASDRIALADGSSAVLGHDTRLRFDRIEPSRVDATIDRGEVTFDVRHSETRTWTVHARDFDVLDRGTRFVVTVSDFGVSVRVESGSVEVIRAGASSGGRKLEAGESWTSGTGAAPVETSPPATTTVPSPPELPSVAPTATVAATPVPTALGARELLESADAARLAGHPREAARAFDTIRTRFRSDPRAGLAAFELGRLRLDALGDPAGAVAAFDDAIVLAPNAGFREDAEARRVEALDRMRDARCPAARRAFLEVGSSAAPSSASAPFCAFAPGRTRKRRRPRPAEAPGAPGWPSTHLRTCRGARGASSTSCAPSSHRAESTCAPRARRALNPAPSRRSTCRRAPTRSRWPSTCTMP